MWRTRAVNRSNVTVSKRDFVANQSGNMVFQAGAPYSASTWVTTTPDHFTLPPHVSQKVLVHVTIPDRPEPGDHQVALVFLVPAGTDANNIRVNRGIGAPVLIAVPGAITDATVVSGLAGPRFALTGPVQFTATIQDAGTIHRDFRGDGHRLTVDVAGQHVEFPDFTILRDSQRDVVTQWKNPPFACICHATISISGANGVTRQTVTVVIFPLHLVGIGVAVLLALLFITRIARRRYRAHIVAAAAAMNGDAGAA